MDTRRPAVAGSFYPSDPTELRDLIRSCYLHPLGPGRLPPAPADPSRLASFVVPHAGYEYSGPVAAHSYLGVSAMEEPELALVVGPNHHGIGAGVSAWKEGFWETPLGKLQVDGDAASELAETAPELEFDPSAHTMEHSIEVQLPFLQHLYGDRVPFLPVSLVFQDLETTKILATAVAKLARGRRTLLIASSDFTHYEPADQARRKDTQLLTRVQSMDLDGFYSTLERLNITACGYGAVATVMQASALLGMRRGEVLKYANSGDTTGDFKQVVGYASVRFM